MPFFIFLAHLISFGVLSDPLPDYVQSALPHSSSCDFEMNGVWNGASLAPPRRVEVKSAQLSILWQMACLWIFRRW